MSGSDQHSVLDVVINEIRQAIDEDWIELFEIDPQTRFREDLELESIEFVKIADALMAHYGADLDFLGWLSGKSINELIGLSVGDVAEYIESALAGR